MYKVLGINDEVTVCDCCGKSDLKCTVALARMDDDGCEVEVVRFGRDCAARSLGWRVSASRAESLVRGRARMDYDSLDGAWRRQVGARIECGQATNTPISMVVDGVNIEVFDTFYGRLPGERWKRVSSGLSLFWRVAA